MLDGIPRDNVVIFSDMEERIGEHFIHDAYQYLEETERVAYPEFELYDAQQALKRKGGDVKGVKIGGGGGAGWDLAKYMNLAMKRRIWTMQQQQPPSRQKKWFVFIDTDTFLDWDNLLELLLHHNPQEKIYLGSPVWLPQLQFAHGGSAYVLSHGAMTALNTPSPHGDDQKGSMYSQYGFNTTALCCGDEALARVLKAKGVSLKGYWPMFNGEVPTSLAFGRDLWCEPVVSLHHLDGKEMRRISKWREEWKVKTAGQRPLLFADLFDYIHPLLSPILQNHENIDPSIAIYPKKSSSSHGSFDSCRAACQADALCFQFMHDGTTCVLSHHFRHGRPRDAEDGGAGTRVFRAGWMLERIRTWAEKAECREGAHWVVSNP